MICGLYKYCVLTAMSIIHMKYQLEGINTHCNRCNEQIYTFTKPGQQRGDNRGEVGLTPAPPIASA